MGRSVTDMHTIILRSAEFVGSVCERDEHVRHETGFFLHLDNARTDIVRQFGERRYRITPDRRAHGVGGT